MLSLFLSFLNFIIIPSAMLQQQKHLTTRYVSFTVCYLLSPIWMTINSIFCYLPFIICSRCLFHELRMCVMWYFIIIICFKWFCLSHRSYCTINWCHCSNMQWIVIEWKTNIWCARETETTNNETNVLQMRKSSTGCPTLCHWVKVKVISRKLTLILHTQKHPYSLEAIKLSQFKTLNVCVTITSIWSFASKNESFFFVW